MIFPRKVHGAAAHLNNSRQAENPKELTIIFLLAINDQKSQHNDLAYHFFILIGSSHTKH